MAQVLEALNAPPRLRVAARVLGWPLKPFGLRGDPAQPPLTRALSALGPAYIKLGQTLATRPDVVGQELADQLRYLQDQLPPFPRAEALAVIAAELERPVESLFSEVSEPVAAASIAQVHSARLADTGRKVAIKVLRPGVERAFRTDIAAFYFVANLIEFILPKTRRLRPHDVIAHFESVVEGELDLRLEAASASEFGTNVADDEGFSVPRVDWSLCSRRVMVLDWADGVPMGDNAALDRLGVDKAAIGARVLQLFLRHALRDGLFHGDMHQGNMKVTSSGGIIAFDFGIMGRIDVLTRRAYAEILFGFIRKDYKRVAEVHFEMGYVPADRDMDEFARALSSVGEPIFGMDARFISMARLLAYLFEVTERFGMETRTELILLQRTMVVVEGVARSLNPEINMWSVARPVVEDYVRDNIGPKALARDLAQTVRILTRFGPQLPRLAEAALIAQAHPPQPTPATRSVGPVAGGVIGALVGAGLMAAGVALGALL
ncbi:MAG: 2-polyprenylphenol 6-hydroxylase [Roseinatronobacter sp.]